MMKLLNNKIFKPQRVLGLNCEITPDGSFKWWFCLLKKDQKGIHIIKNGSLTDINEIKKEKFGLVPVVLVIEGKGVLHKRIVVEPGNPVIAQVIPNALPDDFLISMYAPSNNAGYVSVMRNETVETVLLYVKEAGLSVIDIKVGSFHIANLFQWFNDTPLVIGTSQMEYIYDGFAPDKMEFRKINKPSVAFYSVAGEAIKPEFMAPFVLALGYFIETDETTHPLLQDNKLEFIARRLFTSGGIAILAIAFISLLVNYLFLMYYSDENNKLEKQVSNHSKYLIILDKLKEELKQKEHFYTQSGFSEISKNSFYFDRISSTVPVGISLSGITVNPLVSKIKKEKAIEFRREIISVTGQAGNSLLLNNWIANLEKFPWIDKIKVIQYEQGRMESMATFLLEIELSNQ